MKQTSQNRIQAFAFVISVCAAVCLACGFVRHVREGQSTSSPGETQLENRINPNQAPVASLTRLAGLGPGRAGAIVAYRENLSREGKGPAFRNCDDLQNVRGIGPKTAQGISEWLKFEND
jgi:competence ComEA-like helix-hairpin-helix protein